MHDDTPSESRFSALIPSTSSLLVVPRTAARRIVGLVTGRDDVELYRRVTMLIALDLEDVVLDVGCGEGLGIERAAEIAALGKVCGIETSETLLAAARARNHDAIESGYVELHHGGSANLPWPDATFNKVFAVNSPRDWPQPVVSLSEMRRVMQSGGNAAIIVQPPWRTSREDVRNLAELWAHRLDEAGFHEVRFGILGVGRASVAAVTGIA